MDDKSYYDAMGAIHNPHHVPSTVLGADVKQMMTATKVQPAPVVAPVERREPAFDHRIHVPPRPGILDQLGEALGGLGVWMMRHLWPLAATERAGRRLMAMGWKVRLPSAALGALLGLGLTTSSGGAPAAWPAAQAALAGVAGESAAVVAVGVGALVGWVAAPGLGATLILAAALTGLALGLAVCALVLGLGYAIIATAAGWPPFERGTPAPAVAPRPAP